ncbi:MAG: HK97 gp10 family phage protein [Bacilli bacterium]
MAVNIDDLGIKISDLIKDYADDVKDGLEERLNQTANEILEYIKKNCPRSENGYKHLADSFILTTIGTGATKTIYISSSTKGRLVHLVELGFKHIGGRFVEARPFMRPAYETFTPSMLEDIKSIIRNGGK